MTNLEALKELYVGLGGIAEDVENDTLLADVIAKLKDVAGAKIELDVVTSGGTAYISYNGYVLEQQDLYKLIKGKTPTISYRVPDVIAESDTSITVRYIVVDYVGNTMSVQQFSVIADSRQPSELKTLKTYSLTEAE